MHTGGLIIIVPTRKIRMRLPLLLLCSEIVHRQNLCSPLILHCSSVQVICTHCCNNRHHHYFTSTADSALWLHWRVLYQWLQCHASCRGASGVVDLTYMCHGMMTPMSVCHVARYFWPCCTRVVSTVACKYLYILCKNVRCSFLQIA